MGAVNLHLVCLVEDVWWVVVVVFLFIVESGKRGAFLVWFPPIPLCMLPEAHLAVVESEREMQKFLIPSRMLFPLQI